MSTNSKTAPDVATDATLTPEKVRHEAATIVKPALNEYTKADRALVKANETAVQRAIRLGVSLMEARSVFVQNKLRVGDDFMPWAIEFIGKEKSTVQLFMKLGKNADRLKNAKDFRHADDILAGNAPDDGSDVPEKPKKKPGKLDDETRIVKIIENVHRLESLGSYYKLIAEIEKLLPENKKQKVA